MTAKVNVKSLLVDPNVKLALEAAVSDLSAVYAAGVAGVDTADVRTQYTALLADVTALRTDLAAVVVDLAAARTLLSAHVHGGVTAGGANTSALGAQNALTATAPAALTAGALAVSQPGVPSGAQLLKL